MSRKQSKIEDIEQIAEKAQRGEDISKHFTGQYVAKQQVSIDFPLRLLDMIDTECRLIRVTRQSWIKMACDERLRQIQASRKLTKVS
jgi:hypothetical protein